MKKEDILSLIYEWQKLLMLRKGIERSIEADILQTIKAKPIKIITGFRRSGKSFLTQQIAQKLVNNDEFLLENVLYLNFEDYRLMEVDTPKKLAEIYDLFIENVARTGDKLIIFDEIQNVKNWDKFIRTIYEKSNDTYIILTGSNSEMLSSELGSNLAGRFIEYYLFPFSFREFLLYKKIKILTEKDYYKNKNELEKLFSEFITYGSLPEVFEINSREAKISYLKGITTKVILDDIVKRFGVENIAVLEKIFHYLFANVGNVVSYVSLKNKINSMGIKIKTETIINYVSYFVRSFSLIELTKFNWKQNKIFSASKKYFAIDPGLLSIYRSLEENYSFRIENVVFLHLKRLFNEEICYGVNESNREIDFVVKNDKKNWDKYQVVVDLNEENEKRELGAFELADKYLKKGKNILLTLTDTPEMAEKCKEVNVEVKSIVKWLLGF